MISRDHFEDYVRAPDGRPRRTLAEVYQHFLDLGWDEAHADYACQALAMGQLEPSDRDGWPHMHPPHLEGDPDNTASVFIRGSLELSGIELDADGRIVLESKEP